MFNGFRISLLSMLAATLVFGVSYKLYTYFFDSSLPRITLQGVHPGGCYAGDIACGITSSKKGNFSVWLDGQPLITNYGLSYKNYENPFIIPTKTITNGTHTIKVELADNSYGKNKVSLERTFTVDNMPLQAAFIRPEGDYKVFQGRTLHLQFQANKELKEARVQALSRSFECNPESKNSSIYECFIPVSCEEVPNEYLLTVDLTDKVGNTVNLDSKFQIVLFPFKKQTLQVSPEKIAEEKLLGADTQKLEDTIQLLTQQSPHEKLWRGLFCTPIDIARVTCDFGTIRTTQEKGRYAHKGVDLVGNTMKPVVWAPQDGIIVHKERYAFTGNTVIIDHGLEILSLFFHLDSFADIQVGQKIAQGNPIGTVGSTGYATGAHLHWELRIQNVHVDPLQWTKTNF